MRKLRFRVWNPFIGEMIQPGEEKFIHIEMDGKVNWWTGIDVMPLPGNGLILMQYTGLKDKNDTFIFEGDLLKTPYGMVRVLIPGIYKIWADDLQEDSEVIGNIYEHPHLLKETK